MSETIKNMNEVFQKYLKFFIIFGLFLISVICIIFFQAILFFFNRLIEIATHYYEGHGLIYLITIPILVILPIIYALLYRTGFKFTLIQLPEKIEIKYLLILHSVISFVALWRGGDKWVGPDLPVYFSIVNSIVQDFDILIWNIFNNPGALDRYLIGEPVAFFLLAGIVYLGLPIHFISIISIIFSVFNLGMTYTLLRKRFEEAVASIGALIYIFSPVILRFEADLIKSLFAITFGLLALYFWQRKKIITPIFLVLCVATHIVTASLFFLLLLNLAREEKCLQKFALITALGLLLLLPFLIIVGPDTLYYISIGRIQNFVSQGTFLANGSYRRGFYPHWPDALIIPTIRIITSIGLFLVYYFLNYQNISTRHWSIWVIITSVFIVLGYIFPLLRPERWAFYLGFALIYVIAPYLKREDRLLFLTFLIIYFIAFAVKLEVIY